MPRQYILGWIELSYVELLLTLCRPDYDMRADGYLDMRCHLLTSVQEPIHTKPKQRTSYWTNYKMVHGPAQQAHQ